MGSFMLRNYLCRYGKGIDGAIVMATGSKSSAITKSGIVLAHLIALFRGWKYRSPMMNKMVDGNNNDVSFKYSGSFSQRPSNSNVGFAYFCTDKQTEEGTTNGIMIYHKGGDVWVDALGRVVS